jgi:hypothetical protein
VGVVKPSELPDFRRKTIRWLDDYGARIWQVGHEGHNPYYIPPDLQGLPNEVVFPELVARTRRTLAQARLYAVTEEMTYLALKTGMPRCHVPSDILPHDEGIVVWAKPIGTAEDFTPPLITHGDEVLGMVVSEWWTRMDLDQSIPVVAASWKVVPERNEVFVWFYTLRSDLARKQRLTGREYEEWAQYAPPMMFEREQVIPLDREIAWFTSEDEERLRLSAYAAMTSDTELRRKRDLNVLPMMEQMTKALVATWHLMASKMASRSTIPTDGKTRRAERREGVSTNSSSVGVQVIKLGSKIRTQKPREGEPAFRWKKRRIVGPFVRQQWYPSEETHKPKLIEPYVAGPEGAPISNAEKVYLLSE